MANSGMRGRDDRVPGRVEVKKRVYIGLLIRNRSVEARSR